MNSTPVCSGKSGINSRCPTCGAKMGFELGLETKNSGDSQSVHIYIVCVCVRTNPTPTYGDLYTSI